MSPQLIQVSAHCETTTDTHPLISKVSLMYYKVLYKFANRVQFKLLGNKKKLMSLSFTNMTLWAFPVKVVLSIHSHRLKRRRVIKILYKLLPWSSFPALCFKPEVRIKKRVMFLIDSFCSHSMQIILAGSTTYCCFQMTLFQYLQQNSILRKIKLQIKLYKPGGSLNEFCVARCSVSFSHQG